VSELWFDFGVEGVIEMKVEKRYRNLINRYKIPEEELDGFIIEYNKPMLLELIKDVKTALMDAFLEVFQDAEDELEE
jgi:hypothetical protein